MGEVMKQSCFLVCFKSQDNEVADLWHMCCNFFPFMPMADMANPSQCSFLLTQPWKLSQHSAAVLSNPIWHEVCILFFFYFFD